MTAMKVNNVKLITRYSRAGIQALARGAALAGAGDHCCLMKGTFDEAGGPQEAAVLTVPLCGRHSLFLAGPLAPEAGERFGNCPKKVYGLPARVLDAALRENPEGRSVEIYVGERETDVLGIGFDGGPQEWAEARAQGAFPAERGTVMQEEYDDRYLAKHIVTEYTPAAVRLLLAVVDGTEYRDDILIRGRPARLPAQDGVPSLVTGVPAGMKGEIGLTGPYRGSIPGSWPLNHIEVLRVPRQIAEILAGSFSSTSERPQGRVPGEGTRMVLGSSEGAYCRVEFGGESLQRCLSSLPRFPRSLRLPERDRTGDERIRLLRAGVRGSSTMEEDIMQEDSQLPAGATLRPNTYRFQGICADTEIITFLTGADGEERFYVRPVSDEAWAHTVVSWTPGPGGLPYPHLEVFPDEAALFAAYPCLGGLLRKAIPGWSLQSCCAAHDVYQHWRDESRPNVDLMPIELREKCCFLIRRHDWMRKPLYDHLTLPVGLLEFRPGEAAAVLHVAGTIAGLAFAHPDIQPALDRGLRQSLVVRLERKQLLPANFDDGHRITDPRVTVLPLKGAGQYLLVRRRFPAPAGPGRDIYTLLAWTGDNAGAESLSTDYATLDALVREHPDLEAPLVKHHQDVVPVTRGGAA